MDLLRHHLSHRRKLLWSPPFNNVKKRFLEVRRSNSAYLIHSLTGDWDGLTQLCDNFLKTKNLKWLLMNFLRTSVIFTKCFSMFFLPKSNWFSIGRSSFQLYIAEILYPEKKSWYLTMAMDLKKRKIMAYSLRLRLRKSSLKGLSEKKLQSPCHGY